ncbi:thiopurine S-methyltransferase [Protobothrops mucrosquamatus]|uniref:thiopurine S-methyltransferase n=1 Tax=Protobothrops mucrosquamatus TaxID=103944 RepID=UPI000775C264|nr:thiopurine S-methyltransferase [Protobothrops mucrosquamatus]
MENPSSSSRNEDCDDPKLQWDRVMTGNEWLNCWDTNNIGFHNKEEHRFLKKHLDIFLNGRKELRIFFPLCGKAVEMKWLADMGHHVVGVEISEIALKDFFTEQNLSFSEEIVLEIPGAKLLKCTSLNISLYCCSLYDLTSSVTGHFDGIWDRGSLVAVNPSERERYVQLILSLMNSMCRCLLVTLLYDVKKHKGPPFYVSDSDVKSLFGKDCDIQCLEKVYGLEERHKKWGLDYLWEVLYLVTLKEPR